MLVAAQREFAEEIGLQAAGPFIPLTPVQQKGGKIVHAWACEGRCDTATIASNTFSLQWPPHSGRFVDFPEVDRAEFFGPRRARKKIKPAQAPLIDELEQILSRRG